jgi:hypothetical protein
MRQETRFKSITVINRRILVNGLALSVDNFGSVHWQQRSTTSRVFLSIYLTVRMAFDVLLYTVTAIRSRFDWLIYRYLVLTSCTGRTRIKWTVISRGRRNV